MLAGRLARAQIEIDARRCERAAPRAVELHGGEPALAERDVAAGSVRLGVHLGAPEAMTHDRRIHVARAPARAPEAVRRKLGRHVERIRTTVRSP